MPTNDVTYDRMKAIDTLLRMMGCTDAKGSNCEHVAAITDLADACYRTIGELAGVPIEARLELSPTAWGHREGRLR